MKILEVIPDLDLAGAQIMCENLSKQLNKQGHIVEVISFYKKESEIEKRLENDNIKVHYLYKRSGLDITIFRKIKNIVLDFNPDVIHTHLYALEYLLLLLMSKRKYRIFHTVHNVANKEVGFIQRFIYFWLYLIGFAKPIAISPKVKKTIKKAYLIRKNDIMVIYNGIDTDSFSTQRIFKHKNPLKILHVGRFEVQKNHENIINALINLIHKYDFIEMNFVGKCVLESKIKNIARNSGVSDKIIFHGNVNQMNKIYSQMDVFILPSLWEGMPITLIEAMSSEMPIIVTPVGGVTDMVDSDSAIFVGKNAREIELGLEKIIFNYELRRKLAQNAKKRAEKFSVLTMTNQYIDLFSK